ncbi:MAG: LuxR C-terminal-related transcriptional regulator [Caldilineaceae bacterium]
MSTPVLATKLYIPPPQPNLVLRPRLVDRLNAGLHRKLTLISASAGFGKTTLISAWVADYKGPAAWLSLDEGDRDLPRFLAYLIAALQTLARSEAEGNEPALGSRVLALLQSPQPPPLEGLLTGLLNEMAALPNGSLLVLDDYHLLDAKAVDAALAFLLEHLPPQLHLVITSREDPPLPLARLRARGQLTEIRAADLRFTPDEAADFLNRVMGLSLSAAEIAALDARTEGWIVGLHLAALALQSQPDASPFIQSFTGSHRFVLDYLVEEVLHQQPAPVQTFLLRTSILERLCGPLCDALLDSPTHSGQAALEALESANLFLVPLDNERHWYRYHHLFGDFLRQRLPQSMAASTVGAETVGAETVAGLHIRASNWYEEQGLELDAFYHATAAHDIGRAARLIEGKGMPLHFRGAVAPVLSWLESLPKQRLDEWPELWTAYASTLLVTGQATRTQESLQAADAALQNAKADDKTRDLVGRVAAIRATLAASQQQVAAIITHSERALDYLHPNNLAFRTSTNWKLGYAYHLQGNRAAATKAYTEVIAAGRASGNHIFTIMATIGLAGIQARENRLHLAAEAFQRALQLLGEQPLPVAAEAHFGLAQIYYEWNELENAHRHLQQHLHLTRQDEQSDKMVAGEVLLARLQFAQGDPAGAWATLSAVEHYVRRHNFGHRLADIANAQVMTLLQQGNVTQAAPLAQRHPHPLNLARLHLAQGDPAAALAILQSLHQDAAGASWPDEALRVMVVEAVAYHRQGATAQALHLLEDALALTMPHGFVRTFVDEGPFMRQLLEAAVERHVMADNMDKLLAAFGTGENPPLAETHQPLVDPLSQRELEILHLIAAGHKNQEIADELFISLNTVRYHTKNLYGKLGVNKRTQAVAKAQELGLI